MKASLVALTGSILLVSPALAQTASTSPSMHHRTSKHAVKAMHHRHPDEDGVSVVSGSEIKRDAVGEVIAPRVSSVTPEEKSVLDAPASKLPSGAVLSPPKP